MRTSPKLVFDLEAVTTKEPTINTHRGIISKNLLKYLKILDEHFLFDVVTDPMERANLKDRCPADYARLVAAWDAWNAEMLPESASSFTENSTGAELADHIGLRPVSQAPDPTLPGSQAAPGITASPFRTPR